ncbi:MAG: hypothetical protein ACRDT6_13485 [Micromonosporaceae bacterium]
MIAKAVASLVAAAPPLSAATRERLAELFSVTSRRPRVAADRDGPESKRG